MSEPYQDFPAALRRLTPRTTKVGAPSGSLQGVDTSSLPDGALCIVQETGEDYQLYRESAAVPDGDAVIKPNAGPGRWLKRASGGGGGGPLVGFDAVVGTNVVVSAPSIAAAAALPPILRSPGVPLSVDLLAWTPDDCLAVDWNVSGFNTGITDLAALAMVVPTVDIGDGTLYYINNGSILPTQLGVPVFALSASGRAVVKIGAVVTPPKVRLGLVFFSSTPTDSFTIYGVGVNLGTGVVGSTWLRATHVPAASVFQAPAEVVLAPTPIPLV